MRHILTLINLILVFLVFVFFLLQNYKYIFPDEISSGLSPIRGTEHQIDLVPEAIIPNRPIYKSNLDETKELQKKVEELMLKGYIRV